MILLIERGKDNPILRAPSRPVEVFDDELRRFIEDMEKTLAATKSGIGLAAPQVGENLQLFVISSEFKEEADGHLVYINPVITSKSWWRKETLPEGCLSLPEKWLELPRPQKVKIRAQDEYGESFAVSGQNLLARLYLHEVDHLKGVLFIDYTK